jgi:predicted AlkP superfamily phosphohydrolase/phosphomutase
MATTNEEYISVKTAKEQLGEPAYFAFHQWLVEKGFRNLNEKFVTKDQLQQFIKDTAGTFRGPPTTGSLWGQTREYWRGHQPVKKKRK